MTGSRDIEGMFVFTVGRIIQAWIVTDVIDAFKRKYPELRGTMFAWWVESEGA